MNQTNDSGQCSGQSGLFSRSLCATTIECRRKRTAIRSAMSDTFLNSYTNVVHNISVEQQEARSLQPDCKQLCKEFPDLFKLELGC